LKFFWFPKRIKYKEDIAVKLVLIVLLVVLLLGDIITYLSLKSFLKKHENEPVENNSKGLFARGIVLCVLTGAIGVLGVAITLLMK
jgi:hypothetical protein